MMQCPCCSLLPYAMCCRPLHDDERTASNALALMRSRYSAYALKKAEYIINTFVVEERRDQNRFDIEVSFANTTWTRLEILKVYSEKEHQRVQFAAFCTRGNREFVLKEDSAFRKDEEGWRYWGLKSRPMT